MMATVRTVARSQSIGFPHVLRSRHTPEVLLAPSVLLMFLLMLFPLTFLVYMSLHRWMLLGEERAVWVGLGNFRSLVGDERFVASLARTLAFTAMGLVVTIPAGLFVALVFNADFPGNRLARSLLVLPMVATPVAMGLVWKIILDPTLGVVAYFLSLARLPSPLWLSDPLLVLPTLVLIDAWAMTPMVALICLAGLAALPAEPFESATVDGASGWQKFWSITLPLLRPVLIVAAIFRLIDLLKVIDVIFVVTSGGPGYASETLNFYNFQVGISYFRVGYGAAIAIVLFGMVLATTLVLIRYRRVPL